MKKLLSVLTILVCVAFSASAQTASNNSNPAQKSVAKKQLKKDLHLTKDQSQRLKEMKKESKEQVKQIKENQSLSKAQKHEQMQALKNPRKEKMNAILTNDQQKRLAEFKQANKSKKHAHNKV